MRLSYVSIFGESELWLAILFGAALAALIWASRWDP